VSLRDKLFQRLSTLEAEFAATLRRHLTQVAAGHDTLFFGAERFGPYPNAFLRRQNRPIEPLLELGDEILKLREKVGEPPSQSVLALHRACEEAADFSNAHRLGPVRLAERLLAELDEPAG
jgi:hypothetical protein